jgi:hypothetical protein
MVTQGSAVCGTICVFRRTDHCFLSGQADPLLGDGVITNRAEARAAWRWPEAAESNLLASAAGVGARDCPNQCGSPFGLGELRIQLACLRQPPIPRQVPCRPRSNLLQLMSASRPICSSLIRALSGNQ